jgi:alpha-L-rhamnosidase
MFGAPVAYFFEYLLGIRQTPDSAGYERLVIEPLATSRFGRMAGSVKTPHGTVAVSYEKKDGRMGFAVEIPDGVEAVFRYGGGEYPVASGMNRFEFEIV